MSEDSPISIHQSGATLAKLAVGEASGHWPIPEGTVLAPAWKRVAAFMLDWIVIMTILNIITSWGILAAWSITNLMSEQWWVVLVNWSIVLACSYLYHKYLPNAWGRTIGQRWFGLAVLREDGERLSLEACGMRSFRKLGYIIPILQLICAFIDLRHIVARHTHQSSIDLQVASIVVIANSLPPAKRNHLR